MEFSVFRVLKLTKICKEISDFSDLSVMHSDLKNHLKEFLFLTSMEKNLLNLSNSLF